MMKSPHLLRGISPTAFSSVTWTARIQIVQLSAIPTCGLPGLLMRSSSRQSAAGRCHFSSDGVRYTVQKGRACADDPRDASYLPERFVQVRCRPASSNQGNEHECFLHACWRGIDSCYRHAYSIRYSRRLLVYTRRRFMLLV